MEKDVDTDVLTLSPSLTFRDKDIFNTSNINYEIIKCSMRHFYTEHPSPFHVRQLMTKNFILKKGNCCFTLYCLVFHVYLFNVQMGPIESPFLISTIFKYSRHLPSLCFGDAEGGDNAQCNQRCLIGKTCRS